MQRYIDAKQITGAVTLVARSGRIAHFEAQGLMDIEAKKPMRKDGIFRMVSMTKPVDRRRDPDADRGRQGPADRSGVAVHSRVQGRARWRWRNRRGRARRRRRRRAGSRRRRREFYTVPAERDITVRDLLTHTSGLESGGAGTREGARIAPRGSERHARRLHPEARRGAARLPARQRSGATAPSPASTRSAAIVEVASGLTFDRFSKQRIFDPLGMKDTAFYPGRGKPAAGGDALRPDAERPQASGDARLASTKTLLLRRRRAVRTAEDYLQFAQMLVNGGELNGKRLLSPRTVELMASNHVGDLYAASTPNGGRAGMGFGLTVEVVEGSDRRATPSLSAGSFGWDGAFGTHFWVDRKEQLTGILLIQQARQHGAQSRFRERRHAGDCRLGRRRSRRRAASSAAPHESRDPDAHSVLSFSASSWVCDAALRHHARFPDIEA